MILIMKMMMIDPCLLPQEKRDGLREDSAAYNKKTEAYGKAQRQYPN